MPIYTETNKANNISKCFEQLSPGMAECIICPIAIVQHGTDYKITCVCVSVRAPAAAVCIRYL